MLGEERARLRDRRLARVDGGSGRRAVRDRQQVDDADRASRARARATTNARRGPSPSAARGTAAAGANVSRCSAVTGPISTNAVSRTTLRARRRVSAPGGVRAQPVRRRREPQLVALGEVEQAVEEAARQHHVVVEQQQPVELVELDAVEQRG